MQNKRFVSIVLVCVLVMGIVPVFASAVEANNVCVGSLLIPRATGSFNMTISSKTAVTASHSFPMAAGETVTIKASYAPSNVSVDFGLEDSDGVFHYINVTDGSIDETILIETNRNYTLQIRNNSIRYNKLRRFKKAKLYSSTRK